MHFRGAILLELAAQMTDIAGSIPELSLRILELGLDILEPGLSCLLPSTELVDLLLLLFAPLEALLQILLSLRPRPQELSLNSSHNLAQHSGNLKWWQISHEKPEIRLYKEIKIRIIPAQQGASLPQQKSRRWSQSSASFEDSPPHPTPQSRAPSSQAFHLPWT